MKLHAGYMYSRIEDHLRLEADQVITATNQQVPPGTLFEFSNFFDVENTFNGALVGFDFSNDFGCVSLQMVGDLGIGQTNSETKIKGNTKVALAGQDPFVQNVGLFA